jgi:hypothetical protein
MNDHRDDRELDTYLEGASAVSRQYAELPGAEPPPELDARILAAAEAELKVVPIGRPWQRWAAAVGVAATVTLAFAVVIQLAVDPAGRADKPAPPASVRLMEDAEIPSGAAREKRETSFPAILPHRTPAPAALPSGVVNEVGRAGPRDEFEPVETEADLAGLQAPAPVASVTPPAAPGAFAGAAAPKELVVVDEERLASAVAIIRDAWPRAAVIGGLPRSDIATLEKRAEADAVAGETEDPDAELEAVLRLYDAGDFAGATRRLDEFLSEYPEHPVSLALDEALD